MAETLPARSAWDEWANRLLLGAAAIVVLLVLGFGWLQRAQRPLQADTGLGYLLGILALCCMLLLLLYPLRKRLKFLAFMGPVRLWFSRHQQLGLLATLLALFHCNFQLGSLNSQIALFSTLLIASSGLVGRFLHRRLKGQLNGRRTDLRSVRRALAAERFPSNRSLRCLPLLKARVHRFDEQLLMGEQSLISCLRQAWSIRSRAQREKRVLMHFFRQQLEREALRLPALKAHEERLAWALDRYLFTHMQRMVLIAQLTAYERLFGLWHRVHLPFFVLLFFSVILHVYAVHAY